MPYAAYALGLDHDKFLLEAYFRTGTKGVDGGWKYSMKSCYEQFCEEFPDIRQDYDVLSQYVHRLVKRFRERGAVTKRYSTGRPPVITNVKAHLEENPNSSIRELMSATGLSYGTCQRAKKLYAKSQNKATDFSVCG